MKLFKYGIGGAQNVTAQYTHKDVSATCWRKSHNPPVNLKRKWKCI